MRIRTSRPSFNPEDAGGAGLDRGGAAHSGDRRASGVSVRASPLDPRAVGTGRQASSVRHRPTAVARRLDESTPRPRGLAVAEMRSRSRGRRLGGG
jgi:hypothetical protein